MDNWQKEPDLSWMSFKPQAHHIRSPSTSWSTNNDNANSTRDSIYEPSYNASVSGRNRDRRSKSLSGEDGDGLYFEFARSEQEIVEEEEQLLRRRDRGKEQTRKGSEDFDDRIPFDEPSSSSPLPPPPLGARPRRFHWNGEERVYSFSPRSLGQGFQTRRKSWLQSLEEENVRLSNDYPRLQFAVGVIFLCLLVALAIGVFALYLSLGATVRPPSSCEVDKVVLNFTAQRVRLRGGRYISFREKGVGADKAQHSLLVVHDLLSSRLAGIPGVNDSLLEEFGVRLVSYDRPGYGQSDPHPGRSYNSSAQDMSDIADALAMGEKFWVVGFGNGGPHVWAAIHYIPERLAGVALFAPAGSFYAKNMSKDDVAQTWGMLTMRQKWMYSIARRFPALLPTLLQKMLVNGHGDPHRAMRPALGSKDQHLMDRADVLTSLEEDTREALQQQCAFPMAEELILLMDDWGFSLADLPFKERGVKSLLQQVVGLFQAKEKPRIFSGPIHVWQGTDDQLVPAAVNDYTKRMLHRNDLPKTTNPPLNFHLLQGEGHFSWFWFCDTCHRAIFTALFRPEQPVTDPVGPKGFTREEYEAILAAFGGPKATPGMKSTISDDVDDDPVMYEDNFSFTIADPEEMVDHSTELVLFVPETCQAPPLPSTSKTLEEKVATYIRDLKAHMSVKETGCLKVN